LKGSYLLEEVDGTAIRRSYAGNRLKKFVKRDGYWDSLDNGENEDAVESVDFNDDEDADAEEEATREFRDRQSTQEIEKGTGIVVRVPELSEAERDKYIRFPEDWVDEGNSSNSETIAIS
ncbi:hypothetical protein BDZ45DRAFT_746823, partial [Acephala macrosclerotiorum]